MTGVWSLEVVLRPAGLLSLLRSERELGSKEARPQRQKVMSASIKIPVLSADIGSGNAVEISRAGEVDSRQVPWVLRSVLSRFDQGYTSERARPTACPCTRNDWRSCPAMVSASRLREESQMGWRKECCQCRRRSGLGTVIFVVEVARL